MYGNVDVFLTWRRALLARWAFSHVQGEVFFRRPGHMLAPSRNFCEDLYPKIPSPHAFSHLLPLPAPGDPGSIVFTHSDLGPPEDTGWCLGSISEVEGAPPHAPPRRHLSRKSQDRQTSRQVGGEGGALCSPARYFLETPAWDTLLGVDTRACMRTCVFPGRGSLSPQHCPGHPPTPGLGPGTRFFLTSQVEQTSDWGRGWRTDPEGSLRPPFLRRC